MSFNAFTAAARRISLLPRVLSIASIILAAASQSEAQNTPAAPASAAATPTPAASTNSGPRIQFAESFFDFGRIEAGKIVSHDFAFTNIGDQILIISDVQPACGCTTVTNWAKPVPPGQSGTIPVLFNSSGMAGPIGKFLKVRSNDQTQPELLLKFGATLYKPLDAIPGIAVFNFGPDFQTNDARLIKLVSNMEEPVTLSEPVCTNRSFRAELKTVKEGKEFELRVTVLPPLGPGSLAVPITLKTSSPKMPVVTVTAYAMVQSALTVTPPRVYLPPTPLAKAEELAVTIRNVGTNSVILSDPAINAQGAHVELREVQPGKLFNLTFQFPAGFLSSSAEPIEARVKSNHPQSPTLIVPINQTEN